MANLSLKHIYKVYPNGTKAVNDFNMDIADKEFIVFVGPSGCGKSTTLRMIAGLEDISAGELTIGDVVVNDMEPKDRDIAMVFQNYALYPHMTVYENMTFGLKMRKIQDVKKDKNGDPVLDENGEPVTYMRHYTREEMHERVLAAADTLGITEYLGRKPKEMSGGQRQRVSLGRAIVREPKVMLLDEPLSNLDAKLRTQMRAEIAKLHARLNTTFIYVTHDQIEAMTMGTRIVVMKEGFVQQIDTPKNLYNYPGNKFVAGFIGTPQMNFFEGTLKKVGDNVEINFAYSDAKVVVPFAYFYKTRPSYLNGNVPVYIGLRAEDISIDEETVRASNAVVKVRVSHKEELGNETLLYGDINMEGDGYVESSTRVIIKCNEDVDYSDGDVIDAALDLEHIHLFDKETEVTIIPRVPEYNYLDCEIADGKLRFLGEELELPSAIECEDGEGELLIPTDAFILGDEGIEAKAIGVEVIADTRLLCFEIGGRRLFAIVGEEQIGDTVKVKLDMKKISVLRDGSPIVDPMPKFVRFDGKLEKVKTKGDVEIVKTKKDGSQYTVTKHKTIINFVLDIEGAKYVAPDNIALKLITTLGVSKAFEKELLFESTPYDLNLAEQGISAQLVRVADYGSERFGVYACAGKEVYVDLKEGQDAPVNAFIAPTVEKLGIIQKDMDIRII